MILNPLVEAGCSIDAKGLPTPIFWAIAALIALVWYPVSCLTLFLLAPLGMADWFFNTTRAPVWLFLAVILDHVLVLVAALVYSLFFGPWWLVFAVACGLFVAAVLWWRLMIH